MSSERRQWNESGRPLLPWEGIPGARSGFPKNVETTSTPDRVVLYDAHGKPLTRPRRPFGFRPDDAR